MGVHTCHFFNPTKCSPSSFSFSSEFDPSQYTSRFFFLFTHATFFWVRAWFIWVRLQFYAIHVIFEAIQLPVDQYWNKLRVLGVAIWTDVWVSRGYFFPRPPPSDVMSRLALWRVSGELKKNTKLWIQFNLVSAMQNNLQARRGGSGNADMFQSIFSDWFLLVRADDKTLKRRDDTISSWKQKDEEFKRRPTGGSWEFNIVVH